MPIYTIPDYIKPKDFRNLIEQACAQDILVKDEYQILFVKNTIYGINKQL